MSINQDLCYLKKNKFEFPETFRKYVETHGRLEGREPLI